MNKILFISLVCILLFMSSCMERTKPDPQQVEYEQRWHGFKVIVIDSCEYIIKQEYYPNGNATTRVGYMAHKGNCRFCSER